MSAEPLLSVRDFSVAFCAGGRDTLAVDSASFDVGKGENGGIGRRVRLGQVGDGAVDSQAPALPGHHPAVMRHGRVVESGDAADLFKNPKTDYTRALFATAFNLETAPTGVVAP